MIKNIHPVERAVRVIGGLVIMSMYFWISPSPWFFLGIVPVLTGASGWCPPYQLLGVSTCKREKL